MQKFLLLSLLLALIGVPVLAAREKSGLRSLKKTVLMMAVFNLFFLLAMRFVYAILR